MGAPTNRCCELPDGPFRWRPSKRRCRPKKCCISISEGFRIGFVTENHKEVNQSIKDTSLAVSVVAAVSPLLVTTPIAQVPDPAVLSSEQSKMCHPEECNV